MKGHFRVQNPVSMFPTIVKMFGKWSVGWVGMRPLDLLAQGTCGEQVIQREERTCLRSLYSYKLGRESSRVEAPNPKFLPSFD